MNEDIRTELLIPLDQVFLNLENPRHKPFETEAEAIEWLCLREKVLPLAQDIAKIGLNPFDNFGVMELEGTKGQYKVVEGNRRVCALRLLNDPDLAPTAYRKTFKELAKGWKPIKVLNCAVFENETVPRPWLERRHLGENGGLGQKKWSADQQTRFGIAKNKPALAILDYAEEEGIISAKQRERRITTVRRFLEKESIRDVLGLNTKDPDNITSTRTEEDLKLLVQQFVDDLLEGSKVNSRAKKADVDSYARELGSLRGQSREEIEPVPIFSGRRELRKQRHKRRPVSIKPPKNLPYHRDIADSLRAKKQLKLESLYYSLSVIPLEEGSNAPLLAIGMWAFFETLTAAVGREGESFVKFLDERRLKMYGCDTHEINALLDAIKRISRNGNVTKHHRTLADFGSLQMYTDMDALDALILKLIESIRE